MIYRIFLLIISLIAVSALASCTLPGSQKEGASTGATSSTTTTSNCPVKPTSLGDIQGAGSGAIAATGSAVVLKYYLLDTCGNQMDSSTKDKMGKFPMTIGSGNAIPGFERAVVGMKAGQSRDFTLAPVDAYGEAGSTLVTPPIPRDFFEGVQIRTVDKAIYQDKGRIRQDVDNAETLSTLSVGQQIQSSQDPTVTAKIESISGSTITLVYDNSKSPFYQKPLVVGTKGEKDGVKYEIVHVTDTELTVREDKPKLRVLSNDEIKIGKVFEITSGTMIGDILRQELSLKLGDKVEIVEMTDTTITLKVPNPSPNVGKSLVFHIEVESVK